MWWPRAQCDVPKRNGSFDDLLDAGVERTVGARVEIVDIACNSMKSGEPGSRDRTRVKQHDMFNFGSRQKSPR